MIYNDSFFGNATNPAQLIQGINEVIGYDFLIGNLILLSFFIILLVLTYKHNFVEVLLIDCFVCTILAILLFTGGFIAISTIMFPAMLFFIALIFYFLM